MAAPVNITRRQLLGRAELIKPQNPDMRLSTMEKRLRPEQTTAAMIEEKTAHLRKGHADIIRRVQPKYATVFEEPSQEGCRVNMGQHIPTCEEKPIAKGLYTVPCDFRPL